MKAHLLDPERDLDLERPLPDGHQTVAVDLELSTILGAMAGEDELVGRVAEHVLAHGLTKLDVIRYRQDALSDCLQQPELLRRLYALATDACESRRKAQVFWFRDSPDALVHKSLRVLDLLVKSIKELRALADSEGERFRSKAFVNLFSTLQRELDDEYLASVDEHLKRLEFRGGVLSSASLGRGNRGTQFVLRKPPDRSLFERLTTRSTGSSFAIADRDEAGAQALGELRDRGVRLVANALAQSTDHIFGFFEALRAELAFYVGCLNLYEQLQAKEQKVCFPTAAAPETLALRAREIYDVALVFHSPEPVMGNDVNADGAALIVITGANQGGKSTFLRSVGLAQLMTQAGMFVGAQECEISVCAGLFSHFKREEDTTMTSGKLDEELIRMSEIADQISPQSLLLCNESFAATDEQEGSEIARQVIHAMLDSRVRVIFVTHLYDLAHSLHAEKRADAVFLRAQRRQGEERSYRVSPGEPLPTSYGEDSYERVFGGSRRQGRSDNRAESR